MRHVSSQRHLTKRDLLVGAAHGEFAVGEIDVGIRGFHQVRGDLLGLGFDFVERLHDGSATDRDRPRPIRAHAKRHTSGVAVDDVDVFDRDAEASRDHLCEGGFVALAVAVRSGEHRDAAGRVHTDFTAFEETGARAQRPRDVGRRKAAGLDVAGIADAAQFAACLAFGLAFLKTGDIRQLLGFVHAGVIVTDVVLQRDRRLVGELGNEIALADLVLREAQLPRGAGDNALEQVGGFRATGATVGVDWRGIGKPGVDFAVDLRGGVLAGQQGGV